MTIASATAVNVKITEWLSALRGGTYPQGRNALRRPAFDGNDDLTGIDYCCLGVACDLSGLGNWDATTDGGNGFAYLTDNPDNDDEAHDTALPPEVRDGLGLASDDGEFWVTGQWLAALLTEYPATGRAVANYLGIVDDAHIEPHSTELLVALSLAILNDGGFSFAEIADVIESQPPRLLAEVDWDD